MDDQLVKDFDKYVRQIDDIRSWLEKLYYDSEFASIFNRPVLSMLMTGCEYLSSNLNQLKIRYLTKAE